MTQEVKKSGVNRAKIWQIGFFALNNTSTNAYLLLMTYIAYYTFGAAGLVTAIILNIITAMRLFDGFTDPIIGNLMDKTMTKFGKFRPFIVVGQIIMLIGVLPLITFTHRIDSTILAYIFFIFFYMIYIIGYTCQTAVTKAGQVALTSDPKQRPVFTLFDSIYNAILFSLIGFLVPFLIEYAGQLASEKFFNIMMAIMIPLSIVFAIFAIIGIWSKDNSKYIIENKNPVKIRDLWPILRKNRAIQMLIVAAATDKLASSIAGNSMLVLSALFYSILGYGKLSSTLSIPLTLVTIPLIFVGVAVARKMGQRKALVIFSIVGIVGMALFGAVLLMINPEGQGIKATSFAGLAFIVTYFLSRMGMSVSGGIVIPMIADCADYETYISGKVVPGSMGTLFSFVDKLVSSLATTIISILIVMFSLGTLDDKTPYSFDVMIVFLIGYCLIPILGWIASLIAMKYYPLSKEKMHEVQTELTRLRAEENDTTNFYSDKY